jgi:hypothetical protein
MGKVLTNFTDNTKMVLTDDENKIIAIINVPIGNKVDITDKVIQAIKDDLTPTCAEEANIIGIADLPEFGYEVCFDVECTPEGCDEGETEIRTFNLTKTAEY